MSHRLPVHSERQVHKKPPLTRFWQVPPLEQGLVAQGSTSVNKFIVVRKMGTDYSQLSSPLRYPNMSLEKVLRRGAGATFFNLQIRKAKNAIGSGPFRSQASIKTYR